VTRKRQPLRGTAEIALEVGAVLDKLKMAKHFALDITDTRLGFARKTEEIAAEAALDGIYRERKLIIVEPEAESVRHIFSHYAGCGCCNKCSQPAASPARSG